MGCTRSAVVRTDSGTSSCLIPLRADAERGACRFPGSWSSKVHDGEGWAEEWGTGGHVTLELAFRPLAEEESLLSGHLDRGCLGIGGFYALQSYKYSLPCSQWDAQYRLVKLEVPLLIFEMQKKIIRELVDF